MASCLLQLDPKAVQINVLCLIITECAIGSHGFKPVVEVNDRLLLLLLEGPELYLEGLPLHF